MPKHNTNHSSVTLSTWGTHQYGGNGMAHFIDAGFFGGNVGHAAIEITIPADKEGQALVQKYCMKARNKVIPFERTTQNILDENNKPTQQEVYKIYFSWWPGNQEGFDLRPNLNNDNMHERSGVDVGEIASRFIDPQNPSALQAREQRVYRGLLGARKVNLANKEIAHLTSLNEEQKYLLEIERKLKDNADNIEAIQLLEKKLIDKNNVKVEGTLLSLLNAHFQDWTNFVTNAKELKTEDLTKLKEKIADKKSELIDDKDILITKRDYAKAVVEAKSIQALEAEVGKIREVLSALSEQDKRDMISKRDERFSTQAWVNYELDEVTKGLLPAQSVSVFCLMNNFNAKKEEILEILFDMKYPKTLKDRDNIEKWRQFLPIQYKNISREEMTPEIYQALRENAKAMKENYLKRQDVLFEEKALIDKTDVFFQGDHERFVTKGLSPDNQIHLPVGGIKEGEQQKLGLNVEKMLKQMRHLTEDGKKFHLATKNCSETTGSILAAGAETSLQSYFKQKAWGGFGNPQEVLNGAMEYQTAITQNQGKKTLLEKLSRWNPLNVVSYLGGKMLHKAASPDTSLLGKVALGIGLIPMGVLAAGVETVKAVLNPKKTFNHCTQFVNYAWKNNSVFLKICSLPAAILAGVLAVPAAIQLGIQKAIIEPLSHSGKPAFEKEEISHPERAKLSEDKITCINETNPEQAILKLQAMLQNEPGKIPLLSAQTQNNVNAYMKSLNKNNPEHALKMESYETAVKQIYSRVNEQSLPPQRVENIHREDNQIRVSSLKAFENFKERKDEVLAKQDESLLPAEKSRPSQRPE